MSKPKIKYQQIILFVDSANQEVKIDAESDKLYKYCTGINAVISDEAAKFSTIKLEINSNEVFPEGFEILRIKLREQAPTGFDYHRLEETAGGSKIKGLYKDSGNALAYPYFIGLSLKLENELNAEK